MRVLGRFPDLHNHIGVMQLFHESRVTDRIPFPPGHRGLGRLATPLGFIFAAIGFIVPLFSEIKVRLPAPQLEDRSS
ncbi:MAG: hypothetical protein WA705_07640 [Candidatus Ozemobacteraceae bacterium]